MLRFRSSPLIIRVPFFLLFIVLVTEPKKEKGNTAVLRNRVLRIMFGTCTLWASKVF